MVGHGGFEHCRKKTPFFLVQSVMNHLGSLLKETATSDLAAHREGYRGYNTFHTGNAWVTR